MLLIKGNSYGNNFIVKEVEGKPPVVITGKIGVDRIFRGNIGCAYIKGEGFVRFTPQGYRYNLLISAFQKCIRRCKGNINCPYLYMAIHFALEVYDMGGPFFSNLKNRIIIISSEDIGIANSYLINLIRNQFRFLDCIKEKERKKNVIIKIVYALCNSPKCRWADSIIWCVCENDSFNIVGKFTIRDSYKGVDGDTKKFLKYMNILKSALILKQEFFAMYAVKRLYRMKRKHFCTFKTKTSRGGKSNDPMYRVWDLLISLVETDKYSKKVFKRLREFYDIKKDGRTERLFISHAVLHICKVISDPKWYMKGSDLKDFIVPTEFMEIVKKNEMVVMPAFAKDVHNIRASGEKKKKLLGEFWDNETKGLGIVPPHLQFDPYVDVAKEVCMRNKKRIVRNPGKIKKKSKSKSKSKFKIIKPVEIERKPTPKKKKKKKKKEKKKKKKKRKRKRDLKDKDDNEPSKKKSKTKN